MKTNNLIVTAAILGMFTASCKNAGVDMKNIDVAPETESLLSDMQSKNDVEGKVRLASNTYAIKYYDGGWFPAPGTPNWRTSLILDRVGEEVLVTYQTPTCSVYTKLSLTKFLKLDRLVRSSKQSDDIGADIPDAGVNAITVKTKACNSFQADLSARSDNSEKQAIQKALSTIISEVSTRCLRSEEIPTGGAAPARDGELAVREEFDFAVDSNDKAALELFGLRHPDHFLSKCAKRLSK